MMRRRLSTALLLVLVNAALAHEGEQPTPLVIDTDMGLDDAVALAVALQSPHVEIAAIVACEGAAGGQTAVAHLERMLDLFNRPDIPLYSSVTIASSKPAPPFRQFAEHAVRAALPTEAKPRRQPFSAEAYAQPASLTVLALGPLTNLAAALQTTPAIKERIGRMIIAGPADPQKNWNLSYDPQAWHAVRASGLKLEFVADGAPCKPESWRQTAPAIGRNTSLGANFIRHLLAEAGVREHYVSRWPGFSDELTFLYCTDPDLFARNGQGGVFIPRDPQALFATFAHDVANGRQHKRRVVLNDLALPEEMLCADLRQRREAIIAKNGEIEWFLELLTSELHDHLGAYSLIGAKMGLRAAELLNAPPHAMKVTSYSAAMPPVSCMNDGLIVASGSTPGRGLYKHEPGDAGSTRVRFEYNGRALVLSLKPEYSARIAADVRRLEREFGLARREYWEGVRRVALEIWENWHRGEIFEVLPGEV